MTKDDVKKLVMIVVGAYPNWKPDNLSVTVNVWYETLKDDDYQIMSMALKQIIREDGSGFAPSVGQVVQKARWIEKQSEGEEMTEGEAWGYVQKAMRDTTYHSQERYEELPDVVKRAVGSPTTLRSWGMSENQEVIYSHFVRQYREALRMKECEKMLATDVRRLIENSRIERLLSIDDKV